MRLELDAPLALPGDDDAGPLGPLAASARAGLGTPLMIPVADVDEDPRQPRTEFEAVALQELADSIAQCGMLQAVSVRPHATDPARWTLNFGARRLRACKLLGRTEIAAFVDAAADTYAQVIENEQRENLSPLDLALFVQRRMAAGESQADIARKLGKSRTYVTFATALIDAPDWLMAVYRQGRCRGMQELYALRRLQQERPELAADLANPTHIVTRRSLAAMRHASPALAEAGSGDDAGRHEVQGTASSAQSLTACRARGALDSRPAARKFAVWAELDGREVVVVVDGAPDECGDFFVRERGGTSTAVSAKRLRLLRITCV